MLPSSNPQKTELLHLSHFFSENRCSQKLSSHHQLKGFTKEQTAKAVKVEVVPFCWKNADSLVQFAIGIFTTETHRVIAAY